MSAELWIAIIGCLTTVIGSIRWLLQVYYKQATMIEDLRGTNERTTIRGIEAAVADLKTQITAHRYDMEKLQTRMVSMQGAIAKNTEDGGSLLKALHDYIDTTIVRMNKLETQIIELSKRLILVKGTNGPTNK